jgi:hypothetical protein
MKKSAKVLHYLVLDCGMLEICKYSTHEPSPKEQLSTPRIFGARFGGNQKPKAVDVIFKAYPTAPLSRRSNLPDGTFKDASYPRLLDYGPPTPTHYPLGLSLMREFPPALLNA